MNFGNLNNFYHHRWWWFQAKWCINEPYLLPSTRIITAIIQFPLVICYSISYWILYSNLRLQGSRYQTYLYVTSNLEEFIRVIWEIKIAICENKEAIVTSLFECVKKCRSWPFSIVHFAPFVIHHGVYIVTIITLKHPSFYIYSLNL